MSPSIVQRGWCGGARLELWRLRSGSYELTLDGVLRGEADTLFLAAYLVRGLKADSPSAGRRPSTVRRPQADRGETVA